MPLKKRVLLTNKTWALALLDSAAEVTIVRRSLLEHLEVKATDDFIQVETADMQVSDRVYQVTLRLEGDIDRIVHAIFWDHVVKSYDVLLAEQDWPPDFVRDCPVGEDVIVPSFSPLVPRELAESYGKTWALAQAPALYRNNVGWDRQSPYHGIPIKGTPQPQPQYPIKFEARASVRKILTQLEYQGVIEPCVSPMNNPLFPVAKPDHSYRIVVDYRHLNSHTRTYAIQNSHSAALINNIGPDVAKYLHVANGENRHLRGANASLLCRNAYCESVPTRNMHFRIANRKGCSLPICDSEWNAIPFATAYAVAKGIAVTIHFKWMVTHSQIGRGPHGTPSSL
ncbi:hypothetical protein NDU88_004599 [Pleurodeles waltl]|uniref:Uncharacterized protein n=1 Tax=Pleurodeles waltl TaxID=8319 RepID=A0AAV7NJX9_PLEWA|nr:hypothetical protein NDU88_004599 [Pleurodeles waltl]